MSQPTPDGRAVVRALDALTTQVKRIADHTARGSLALMPAADEDAQRTTRRASLHNLIVRATQGALTTDESAMLWHHVEAEQREADTARAVAAGNKRHVQLLTPALERAEADANHNADLVADAVSRADTAERELRVLRSGLRANGADPTQIQNLWAQIRLRNRQWRDAKRERDEAQAAIDRVRHLVTATAATTAAGITDYDIGRHDLAVEVLAELDGTAVHAAEAVVLPEEPA